MQTYKDILKQVRNSRRVSQTVFVISVCQVRPGGPKYYNYFIARPNKFTPGQIIPKKSYKEKVITVI
jgi:hypothetical protein